MHSRIIEYLMKQTSASICCVDTDNEPYSFSCFYVFNADKNLLYYKSSAKSYHSKLIKIKPKLSGTVMPDKLDIKSIKGVQFLGEALNEDDELCADAYSLYHERFPIAIAIPREVQTIKLNLVKMTDNFLGISKKHNWQREEKPNII